MDKEYYEFGTKLISKIKQECNGDVTFEAYEKVDMILIRITFKGYRFNWPCDYVQNRIACGESINDIYKQFKDDYSDEIHKSFFKSQERKKRDKERDRNELFV